MTTVYALLVGINRYASPDVPELRGCVRDVESALAHLTRTLPADTRLSARTLHDGAATRDAVIEGIRTHLGQAGTEDTALFWFSGHGSHARCPEWAWFAEPGGRLQTLVCADSRTPGVPDLWDKELSVLLDGVARRAAHVAVVLDSCHSDGATRDLPATGTAARTVPEAGPRRLESLVPELIRTTAAADRPDHLALAACRGTESALEMRLDGAYRGVFSWALLRARDRLGPAATYRELAAAVRTDVEQRVPGQTPQLRPAASALADHSFLSARPGRSGATIRMRYLRGEWEIDAGAVHGLRADDGLRVGVPGGGAGQEAAVTRVLPHRSQVVPAGGWEPDRDRPYPVVVTSLGSPRLTVALTGEDSEGVRRDLRTAGPGGGPSPYVREVESGRTADFRAETGPGLVRLTDGHGRRLAEVRPEQAVPALEHLARWTLLSTLHNPLSELTGAVRIEVIEADTGTPIAPRTGGTAPGSAGGDPLVSYRRAGRDWQPPEVFIRLHNTSDRPLYCVLLDLTPRFRVHAALFPGDYIAPGRRAAALDGRRISAHLPAGQPPVPGVRVRDQLKLLVAGEQFSADPFLMPGLGEPSARHRGVVGPRGLLERIGGELAYRDLGAPAVDRGAYDWTAEEVTLVTEVPL